jgi:hypothetical protein
VVVDKEEKLSDVVKAGVDAWAHDTDKQRPYWDKMHDHLWDRAWGRITSTAGRWLIGAIMSGGAAALVIYAVKAGWIK